jgi:alpha-beta hydrolase superfamily lysophospholipase
MRRVRRSEESMGFVTPRWFVARLIWHPLKALVYALLGASVVFVAVGIYYLDSRSDLEPWHLLELDQEFVATDSLQDFADYLALEDRLFAELASEVYGSASNGDSQWLNRYVSGSLSDPQRWSPNWNRTFELPVDSPRAGVLLLHGMSDSPYSLRQLGLRLQSAQSWVVGLRLPGHGTAPSGLVEVRWQDMAAAVRLGMKHLAAQAPGQPLYIVGYSNGAALAVHYALLSVNDSLLPTVSGLGLVSPAIGVTGLAALAVWQARLGHLLGLDKLAWNSIQPEYDAFKYGSFAVNAGDQVYRLTREIDSEIGSAIEAGTIARLPPILAFQSVVDATVSPPALVGGLYHRLPRGGHELVLFDVNRASGIEPLLNGDPTAVLASMLSSTKRNYTLKVVTNESPGSLAVVERRASPDDTEAASRSLAMRWPDGIYSLSHVALPFSPDDPLYGGEPRAGGKGLHLGALALRGERGVLRIDAAEMMRLRYNPFYEYLEDSLLAFFGLDGQSSANDGEGMKRAAQTTADAAS